MNANGVGIKFFNLDIPDIQNASNANCGFHANDILNAIEGGVLPCIIVSSISGNGVPNNWVFNLAGYSSDGTIAFIAFNNNIGVIIMAIQETTATIFRRDF